MASGLNPQLALVPAYGGPCLPVGAYCRMWEVVDFAELEAGKHHRVLIDDLLLDGFDCHGLVLPGLSNLQHVQLLIEQVYRGTFVSRGLAYQTCTATHSNSMCMYAAVFGRAVSKQCPGM